MKQRVPKAKELESLKIVKIIMDIHEQNYKTYGGFKMKHCLEKQGFHIGLGRIYRLMRQNGIYTVHKYKHRPKTKKTTENIYQDNLLNREFKIEPNYEIWYKKMSVYCF